MLFLDTSIVVALYIPEEKSSRAEKLIAQEKQLAVCSLTEVEFNSAVSRQVRMKALSRNQGHQVISEFQLHQKQRVFIPYPIMQKDYEIARDWLSTFDSSLRTLDALHLAVAYSNKLTLATADKDFAKSAKVLGISVRTI